MLLLDTNVVSELRKVRIGRADRNVAKWAEALDTASLFISVITVHELEIGTRAKAQYSGNGSKLSCWQPFEAEFCRLMLL
jgi:predicted nucleic acid-binding protein